MTDIKNNIEEGVFPPHPEPNASTYDDGDEEEEYEQKQSKEKQENDNNVDLEHYFEIILMTSPVAGVKYYLPIREATDTHALMIQNPPRNIKMEVAT